MKLSELQEIGLIFDLRLNLPPFQGNINECFFDIDAFKEKKDFSSFLTILIDENIYYEYAKDKNKIYLVINLCELEDF